MLSVSGLTKRFGDLPVMDAFEITRPLYAHSQMCDREKWQKFSDFALRYGLIEKRVDVTAILGR